MKRSAVPLAQTRPAKLQCGEHDSEKKYEKLALIGTGRLTQTYLVKEKERGGAGPQKRVLRVLRHFDRSMFLENELRIWMKFERCVAVNRSRGYIVLPLAQRGLVDLYDLFGSKHRPTSAGVLTAPLGRIMGSTADILTSLTRMVHAYHEKGIWLNDLKPENAAVAVAVAAAALTEGIDSVSREKGEVEEAEGIPVKYTTIYVDHKGSTLRGKSDTFSRTIWAPEEITVCCNGRPGKEGASVEKSDMWRLGYTCLALFYDALTLKYGVRNTGLNLILGTFRQDERPDSLNKTWVDIFREVILLIRQSGIGGVDLMKRCMYVHLECRKHPNVDILLLVTLILGAQPGSPPSVTLFNYLMQSPLPGRVRTIDDVRDAVRTAVSFSVLREAAKPRGTVVINRSLPFILLRPLWEMLHTMVQSRKIGLRWSARHAFNSEVVSMVAQNIFFVRGVRQRTQALILFMDHLAQRSSADRRAVGELENLLLGPRGLFSLCPVKRMSTREALVHHPLFMGRADDFFYLPRAFTSDFSSNISL